MSMTVQPASCFPPADSHGNPPAASISSHTCLRILALACAIRVSVRSSARFRVRRTVESDGAAPSTGASWPSTSVSDIDVAPNAIAIAVDASAVDRMQPSGMRYSSRPGPDEGGSTGGMPQIFQVGGSYDYGRSVSPNFVEDVIGNTAGDPQENGNYMHDGGGLQVILSPEGRVVTVMTN
jgi:hypothetical protein